MPSHRSLFVYIFLLTCALVLAGPRGADAQALPPRFSPLPLAIEPNEGQAPETYKFLVRQNSSVIYFLGEGVDIFVPQPNSTRSRLRIRWAGDSAAVSVSAEGLLLSRSSYFRGSDPSRWLHDVPQYARIRYGQIYPGIDLLFHGREGALEHDFQLQPGADPGRISLRFDRPLRITRSGDLLVTLGKNDVYLMRPVAYQKSGDSKKEIPARFVLARNGEVKFHLGSYDHTRDLVIDPVFVFSTYLDGSNNDTITAVTTDASGDVFVTGFTGSTDFPVTNAATPLCPVCSENSNSVDTFISKLDPAGHTLLYSAFLGGSTNATYPSSISLDKNRNIYLAGVTGAFDFPHTGGVLPFVPTQFNQSYFFAASIKSDGSALNYSGIVGGIQGNFTNGTNGKMTVDASGSLYLTGTTDDSNFQLTPGVLGSTPTGYPNDTMFVLKLDPTGKLVYSTLVPGNSPRPPGTVFVGNFVPAGIAADANGQVVVAGLAGAGLPAKVGALESMIPNPQNLTDPQAGFVLQLNSNATALNFATYLPGTDSAGGLAVDANGNLYITGSTSELNLPVSANAFQKALIPGPFCTCNSAYVMKLDSQAKSVLAATYLSGTPSLGNAGTTFTGIALDSKSNVLVGGMTGSTDFPLKNPFVTTLQFSISADGLVMAELNPDLSGLLFGSFLSSTTPPEPGSDFSALTFDAKDHAIVVGTTLASDFPTTANSFQPSPPPLKNPFVTSRYSFISELDLSAGAPSVCLSPASVDFGSVLVNTSSSQNLNITNCGNAPLQISSVQSSVPSIVPGQSCATVAQGSTCALQLTFTPTDGNPVGGVLTLTDNAATSPQTVGLSGTGGTPQIQFPPAFQVDDQFLGTHSESGLSFINTGGGNWIVNSVVATGDFSVKNQCTAPLPPSMPMSGKFFFCSMAITFSPTQPGLRTGTLTITDNAAGSPHVIQLSGNSLTIYATPSISSIIAVPTDAQMPSLQIGGNNFFPASQVFVNGSPRTTQYQGETFLTADLTSGDLAQPGELTVTVSNPGPGGGASNSSIATIYAAIRGITFLHTVYDSKSGHLLSSVGTPSPKYANQVVEIDPSAGKVLNAWNVGNGPNQLAISDDGQFLYVGLDGDKKVAQVALPAGTVNFTVGLGNDPLFQQPMVAEALRVFPGHPHSWAVTLCGVGFIPCGEGIAVFDDATQRPTLVSQNQLEPDALTFVGQDATLLYGTTLFQLPSTFYEFAINSSGISLSNSVTNFAGPSAGGGALDTDGTSIYVSNGQVIDPTTMSIKSGGFQPQAFSPAFKVDVPASRVYFAGNAQSSFNTPLFFNYEIQAFDLVSQQPTGSILMTETGAGQEMYRWGSNGLAIAAGSGMLFVQTSLTNSPVSLPQFSATSILPSGIPAGSPDLTLNITGSGFASGDSVTANGTRLQIGAVTPTQITATVPAALLSVSGDVQIAVADTNNHVDFLILVVLPETTGVALSTNYVAFNSQVVATASSPASVMVSNTGATPLIISSITSTGDFSQTNTCGTVGTGGTCSISVIFKPSAAGNRVGAMAITDNDPTQSQTVALSGIGADVQITPSGSSSTTATISAGQNASYMLAVTPEGGFTGQVSVACSNLPKYAACSFNSSNLNLGTTPVNVMVTITTGQQQAGAIIRPDFSPLVALVCLGLFVLVLIGVMPNGREYNFHRVPAIGLLFLALAFMPLAGCTSSASSSSPSPPASFTTPPGNYTINFTVTNSLISRSIPLTLIVK
jgi:hypothetical protein